MTSMTSSNHTKKGNANEQRDNDQDSMDSHLPSNVRIAVGASARELLLGGREMSAYYNNDMNGWIVDHDFEELAKEYYDRETAIDYITSNRLEDHFLDWLFLSEDEVAPFDEIIEREEADDELYEYIVHDNYERSEDYARFAGWGEQEPDYYI